MACGQAAWRLRGPRPRSGCVFICRACPLPAPGWPAPMHPAPRTQRSAIVARESASMVIGAFKHREDPAGERGLISYGHIRPRGQFTARREARRPGPANSRKMVGRHFPNKGKGASAGRGSGPPTVRYRPVACRNGAACMIDFAAPAGERRDSRRRGTGSALPADNHRSSRHNGRRRDPGRVSI